MFHFKTVNGTPHHPSSTVIPRPRFYYEKQNGVRGIPWIANDQEVMSLPLQSVLEAMRLENRGRTAFI
jgi:hypothetical protein